MSGQRIRPLIAVACALGAVVLVPPNLVARATAQPARIVVASLGWPAPPGGFIVRVKDPGALDRTLQSESSSAARGRVWRRAVNGFVATLSSAELAALNSDPDVLSIEPDAIVHATGEQGNPPWGLDRIDQRAPAPDHVYSYGSTGAGVTVYVVDTGIRTTHTEFTGRIAEGAAMEFDDNGVEDCSGHGTHVSGIIGGTTYGVAKQVTLVPVRVLSCAGTAPLSAVIDGLDWVVDDHVAGEPAVVNLSLGGGPSPALDAAVNAVIADGITVVTAAGNEAMNTCNYSPGGVPAAITVGATESDDHIANYSNYGACNDIFAPGDLISSAWITSDTARATQSGTSMAAPHVTGAVARLLEENPKQSPAQVWAELNDLATTAVLSGTYGGDPDKLLYVLPAPPGPSAPRSLTAQRGDGAVTLSWLPPADDHGWPVTDYVVQYRPAGGEWSTFADGASTTTAATITGLSNGRCYEFAVYAVNAHGAGAMVGKVFATPAAHGLHAVDPARLIDTRPAEPQGAVAVAKNQVGPNATLDVKVGGAAGLPDRDVAAVSLNVTAVDASGPGFVTVYDCGERLLASNLNYSTTAAVANAVISPLSADGRVCFYSSNATDLVVDVNGWYPTASGFTALQPRRLFDTRSDEPSGPIIATALAGGGREALIAGVPGVPDAGVAAVSLNVTVVDPAGAGFVTVYPCGDRPLASNINYTRGAIVANAVIAQLSVDGTVCFFTSSPVDLVVDVSGWFAAGSTFAPIAPTRLFDTRSTVAQGVIAIAQQQYGDLRVDVRGVAGLPIAQLAAVTLNLTVVGPVDPGFVTVYPCGDRPLASNVNYEAGQIVANAITARVSDDGGICIHASAATDLVADVNGWFASE